MSALTLSAPPGAAGAQEEPASSPLERALGVVTPWRTLALVAGLTVLHLRGLSPFVDIDLYWHVRLGEEILRGGAVRGTGTSWAYTLPDSTWVTTQWLSEVVLALVHDIAGWRGIAALRFACSAGIVVGLAVAVLRGRRSIWAPVVFTLSVLVASGYFQERPLLASMLLSVWLGGVCARAVASSALPSTVPLLALTWLWANLHGQWVVVPGCLGLLALGRAVEWGRDRDGVRPPTRLVALTVGSTAAGAFTPYGPALLLAPFTFRSATVHHTEWAPTSLSNLFAIAFALVVLLVVLAWSLGAVRPRVTEVVLVVGLCAFASVAMRNVPPTALLLAPLAAHRLALAFPRPDRCHTRRERKLLAAVLLTVAVVAAVALPVRFAATQDVPAEVPVRLARHLAQLPGDHYVVNDYNVSGALVFWGGSRTRVAVDGRADRYGGAFIDRYQSMMAMRAGWRDTFAELRPNYVVPELTSPLVEELGSRGWTREYEDGAYVLLRAPGGARSAL